MKQLALLLCLALWPYASHAADLGVHGETWPIIEDDLLSAIEAELNKAHTDGRLTDFNNQVENQLISVFNTPPALPLKTAIYHRSWVIDPSIIVRRDIRDHEGRLIAAAGTKVNPLANLSLDELLIFIDGRDETQLSWAFDIQEPAKIILTGGNPSALMSQHNRRLYFDQKRHLVDRFQIMSVPAIVRQDGDKLRIDEIAITGGMR